MYFSQAMKEPQFMLMFKNLQSEYPEVDFLDESKTFYKAKDIYRWLSQRYNNRIVRYSKDEFGRYFEQNLLNNLQPLYVKQQVFMDGMISSLKDAKMRGAITERINNDFHSPGTYADKATALTSADNVAGKAQSTGDSQVYDIILDMRKVLNIRIKKPIAMFLDTFNDLFKSYLTEDELVGDINPTDDEIYNEVKSILLGDEFISFTPDDKARIIKVLFNKSKLDTKMDVDMKNATLDSQAYINNVVKGNLHNENYDKLITKSKTVIKAINEAYNHGGGGGTGPSWWDITSTFDNTHFNDDYVGTIWRVTAHMKATSGGTPEEFDATWYTFITHDLYHNTHTGDYAKKWQNDLGWVQGIGVAWGNISYGNNYYDVMVTKIEESSYKVPMESFNPTQANIYPTVKPMLKEGVNITVIPNDGENTLTINSTYEPTKQGIYPGVADILTAGDDISISNDGDKYQVVINSLSAKKDLTNVNVGSVNAGRYIKVDSKGNLMYTNDWIPGAWVDWDGDSNGKEGLAAKITSPHYDFIGIIDVDGAHCSTYDDDTNLILNLIYDSGQDAIIGYGVKGKEKTDKVSAKQVYIPGHFK